MGWRQNVVIATLVIVEGTGGGLFVYNGTPGPANPPVFSVVAPGVTKDPYGNTVAAVMEAGVPGTGQTQIDQSGNILLAGPDGSPVIQLNPSHQRIQLYSDPAGAGALLASLASVAGTDQYGNTYPQGLLITTGLIQGTTFEGAEFIINTAGAFFYATTPAFGNLIATIANSGGTDSFGNAYIGVAGGGYAAYTFVSPNFLATAYAASGIQFFKASSAAGPYTSVGTAVGFDAGTPATRFPALPVIISQGLSVTGGITTDTLSAGAGGFTVGNAGAAAISAGGHNPLLTVTDTTSAPGNPNIEVVSAAAGDRGLGLRVTGDTVDRIVLRSDNSINLGSGSAATDTVIYRGAAGQLVADYIAHNESGSPETWHTPTLGNSWTNSGQGPVMQYRHVAAPYNCVQLVGDLTGGTLTDGTVIFTLPAGYRPATGQTCPFMVPGTNAAANMRFQVNSTGAVLIEGLSGLGAGPRVIIPANTLISLDA